MNIIYVGVGIIVYHQMNNKNRATITAIVYRLSAYCCLFASWQHYAAYVLQKYSTGFCWSGRM